MPTWALPAFSWLISFYFLAGFTANVSFPPERRLFSGDALFAVLWLFFLFLPFYKKIKIGPVLELEREVEKVREEAVKAKEELREFKTEIRSTLQVLSTNVNTIGGMSNQITLNLPGLAEMARARAVVDQEAPPSTEAKSRAVEEEITSQSEDTTLALAKTRIEIERLLRTLVGRVTKVQDVRSAKFLGLNKLLEMFLLANPQYGWMREPFRTVIAVCNAAMHAQQVPDAQAEEALALGARIIATLQDVGPNVD
jgi:hypothetical protein